MDQSEQYVTIAKAVDIPDEEPLVIVHNGWRIAIYRDGGSYYACLDVCPHMGAFLSRGFREGSAVVCPWHNWAFDLPTGKCLSNETGVTVQTFPIQEVSGDLMIPVSCLTDSVDDELNET